MQKINRWTAVLFSALLILLAGTIASWADDLSNTYAYKLYWNDEAPIMWDQNLSAYDQRTVRIYAPMDSEPSSWLFPSLLNWRIYSVNEEGGIKRDDEGWPVYIELDSSALSIRWDIEAPIYDVYEEADPDSETGTDVVTAQAVFVTGYVDLPATARSFGDPLVTVDLPAATLTLGAMVILEEPATFAVNIGDAGNMFSEDTTHGSPGVRFEPNRLYRHWAADFVVWRTDDDGKTWYELTDEENLLFDYERKYIFILGSPENQWVGVCFELKGNSPCAGQTDSYFFKFDPNEGMEEEPAGGDRNADKHLPYVKPLVTPTTPKGSARDSSVETKTDQPEKITQKQMSALLIVYPQSVPFSQNGVELAVPASFIKGLGMGENSQFSLSIQKKDDSSITIGMTLDGRPIAYTGSQPMEIRIAYAGQQAGHTDELVLVDERGIVQPFSYYNNNQIILKSYQVGSFKIIRTSPLDFKDTKDENVAFLSARNVVAGAGNNTFEGSRQISACELITMLYKLENPSKTVQASASEKWYDPYMSWASAKGIINQNLPAQKQLTFEEAVKQILVYGKSRGTQATTEQLLKTLPSSTGKTLTRTEAAALLVKFIGLS